MTPDHALEAAEELLFGHLPRPREGLWRCYSADERRMLRALAGAILRDSSATIITGKAGSA